MHEEVVAFVRDNGLNHLSYRCQMIVLLMVYKAACMLVCQSYYTFVCDCYSDAERIGARSVLNVGRLGGGGGGWRTTMC